MTCKCGSNRIIGVSAHSSDLNVVTYNDMAHEGYIPYGLNIGGGDDVEIDFCADCGAIQDFEPLSDQDIRKAFNEDEED